MHFNKVVYLQTVIFDRDNKKHNITLQQTVYFHRRTHEHHTYFMHIFAVCMNIYDETLCFWNHSCILTIHKKTGNQNENTSFFIILWLFEKTEETPCNYVFISKRTIGFALMIASKSHISAEKTIFLQIQYTNS